MVSVFLHLLVLTVFGFLKLSRPANPVSERQAPTARVSQLKNIIEKAAVLPKPKVKKPSTNSSNYERKDITTKSSFFVPNLKSPNSLSSTPKILNTPEYSFADSGFALGGVEFFGSETYERKICYVVDCSGSMQGMMGQVQQQLKDSIKNLLMDQYFHIIFFGDGKLFEFGDGKLVRSSQKNKTAAYTFIDSIRAGGRTNAFKALERAVQIEDGSEMKASVFYFLTDGFELANDESESLYKQAAGLIKRFAPSSKINTIGFWPTEQDRSILRAISALSGGECVIITDHNF
jgi:hypothetical protein